MKCIWISVFWCIYLFRSFWASMTFQSGLVSTDPSCSLCLWGVSGCHEWQWFCEERDDFPQVVSIEEVLPQMSSCVVLSNVEPCIGVPVDSRWRLGGRKPGPVQRCGSISYHKETWLVPVQRGGTKITTWQFIVSKPAFFLVHHVVVSQIRGTPISSTIDHL